MAIHALLPLERHDEARDLLVEVYSRNVGASPELMRARPFEMALTIELELELDDDDWSRIERVIAT